MNESPCDEGYEPGPATSPNPISQYLGALKSLLTAPTLFFRTMRRPPGLVGPLFFGVLTHWIGSALEYLWFTGLGKVFGTHLSQIFQALDKSSEIDSSGQVGTVLAMRTKIVEWMFGVGSVLVDPFKTTVKILFLSFFVWLGARIFANITQDEAEERFSYQSAVAIVGFSMAASIFQGIPLLGGVISGAFTLIIGVIGAAETYRVGTGRALLISLFPFILFWGLIVAAFVAFFSATLFLLMR